MPPTKFVKSGRDSEHRPGEVKLHVCNLPYSTSHWQIGALFGVYGEVLEAFVFKRPNMQNGCRSALVRMATSEAAAAAAADLDNRPWRGCILRVRRSYYDGNGPEAPEASETRSIRRDRQRRRRKNEQPKDDTTAQQPPALHPAEPVSPGGSANSPSTPLSGPSTADPAGTLSYDGLESASFVHDPYSMAVWGDADYTM